MKLLKKIILIILSGYIFLNTFLFMNTFAFGDDVSYWAKDALDSGVRKGYITHSLRNKVKENITREEFCDLSMNFLSHVMGISVDDILLSRGLARDKNTFSDTCNPNILAAYALKITTGTGNNKFSPKSTITREQAATMIHNVCKIIDVDSGNLKDIQYEDMYETSNWALKEINFCLNHKIMNGTNELPLQFSPKRSCTKEQIFVSFDNIDKIIKMKKANIIFTDNLENTNLNDIKNLGYMPSVKQFQYKDEGLAYAYKEGENLIINTPKKSFKIQMEYPALGDVIADEEGNFYIIWGRENTFNNKSMERCFISKYNEIGEHIKTTGFVGCTSSCSNDSNLNSKKTFNESNCVSIKNGNYHRKENHNRKEKHNRHKFD